MSNKKMTGGENQYDQFVGKKSDFRNKLSVYANEHKMHSRCIKSIGDAKVNLAIRSPFFSLLLANMNIVMSLDIPTFATDMKNVYFNPFFCLGLPDELVPEYTELVIDQVTTNLRSQDEHRNFDLNDGSEFSDSVKAAIEKVIERARTGLTMYNYIAVMCHEVLHCAFSHFVREQGRDHDLWNKATDYVINGIITNEKIGLLFPGVLYRQEFDGMTSEQVYDLLLAEPQQNKEYDLFDMHKKMTESDETEFRDRMVAAANAAGNLPKGLQGIIDQIRKPRVDWRNYLRRVFKSLLVRDMSFQKSSRRTRSMAHRCKLPGFVPDQKINILIAIDMSGSTSGIRDAFFGEIYGMLSQNPSYDATLLCFDTEVYNVVKFQDVKADTVLKSYEVAGDGGTMFECVWDYMKTNRLKPAQLVLLTDGYPCGTWGVPGYVETIFLVAGGADVQAPFGKTLIYEQQ